MTVVTLRRRGYIRSKNTETEKAITDFADEFFRENLRFPSLREIEKALGISRQTARRYLVWLDEKGELEYDRRIRAIRGGAADPRGFVRVPVAGAIPCGAPSEHEEQIESYASLPKELLGEGEFFLLIASGDSMTGAGIDDGDLVLVRRQSEAKEGQIVAALVDGNATTLKRFYRDDQKRRAVLRPENKNYGDIASKDVVIQGIALKVIKDLN